MASQTLQKLHMEEMRGMGLINEEMLKTKNVSFFESTQSEKKVMMVTIADKEEGELGIVDADKTSVKSSVIRGLLAMGIFDKTKIDNKEISINRFASKYDTGTMIALAKADDNGFDALIAEPVVTTAEMSNDGTLDMDAQADAAQADIEARGIGVGAEMF